MSDTHGTPPEGLECLATMEDITTEDGNYGKIRFNLWKPACEGRQTAGEEVVPKTHDTTNFFFSSGISNLSINEVASSQI